MVYRVNHLKALIIEDREAMRSMFCEILEKRKVEYTVEATVDDGLRHVRDPSYKIAIVDSAADGGDGMRFVSEVVRLARQDESRSGRRYRVEEGPGIIFVHSMFEKAPEDCVSVRADLVMPFGEAQLVAALEKAMPKGERLPDPVIGWNHSASDPESDLNNRDIVFGESYVFFQQGPNTIRQAMESFARAGYPMLLITAGRAKVARERFGLDRGAEVFTLSGNSYPLGTMVDRVRAFVEGHEQPVIAIDDLDNVIEHNGTERALRAVQEVLSMKRVARLTLLVSVDGDLLPENVRGLLSSMMVRYSKED